MASVMNTHSNKRETAYIALAFVPLGLLPVALIGGIVREGFAANQVHGIVSQFRAAGEPTNFASLTESLDKQSSKVELAKVLDVESAAQHLNNRYNDLINKCVPNTMELQARRREASEPIIERCMELGVNRQYLKGDIIPYEFNRGYTSLHGIKSELQSKLMELYKPSDREEAMEILRLTGCDPELVVSTLHYLPIEDLRELRRRILESQATKPSWPEIVSLRRGDFLASVERIDLGLNSRYRGNEAESLPFGAAPSHVLARLSAIDRLQEFQDITTAADYQAVRDIEKQDAFSLVAFPTANSAMLRQRDHPHLLHYAHRYWKDAMLTRRVITAIAIKQFQLQEGRWPNKLDELTKVGLTPADWKIAEDQDFGYRIVDNGYSALLWTAGFTNQDYLQWYEEGFRTPENPPSSQFNNSNLVREMEIRIHK